MSISALEQFDKDAQSILSESAEFSESIEIVETGFSGFCIFDKTYEEFDPDTGAVQIVYQPRVILSSLDMVDKPVEQYQTATIRNKDYEIINVEEDVGTGIILIYLKNKNE